MSRRPTGRARGAQPGNRNALKHGRYARVRRQIGEFDHFLRMHHYQAAVTGDRRVLKRDDRIIQRLAREKAALDQAVMDRHLLKSGAPAWIVDEIARADRENRADEIE
jgi:hypothetical protein